MSLLDPKAALSKAERVYNDCQRRQRSLIRNTSFFIIITALCCIFWPHPVSLSFCGAWLLLRLYRSVRFFMWKKDNRELLAEGLKILQQKEKRALKKAEREARLQAISGNLSPDELFRAVAKQADYATKAVKELPYDNSQLIDIIEHNVNEINKLTSYLSKLEEYIEEENPTLLAKEKEAVVTQLKNTSDNMIINQLNASLDLLEQRITESQELLLEAKRIRSKITTFQQAIESIGLENIATNQIELSPYLQNHQLVDFLQAQNIDVTSYMTLAYGKVLNDPVLMHIAQQHQVSTAQISLAWALQRGFAVIPSSTKREHLMSNLKAQEIQLSSEEMMEITQLDRNQREVNPEGLAPLSKLTQLMKL